MKENSARFLIDWNWVIVLLHCWLLHSLKHVVGTRKTFIGLSTAHRILFAQPRKSSQSFSDPFSRSPPKHVARHWNGKLTKTRTGDKVETSAVITSGSCAVAFGGVKLSCVPTIKNSSGKQKLKPLMSFPNYEHCWQTQKLWFLISWQQPSDGRRLENVMKIIFYHACCPSYLRTSH